MIVPFIVTLAAFIWVMPKKEAMEKGAWYEFIPRKIALLFGFLADVIWNVFYGTIIHFIFSSKSSLSCIPPFDKVTDIEKLYVLTLTKRMQAILDYDPVDSVLYKLSDMMRVLLNKYDPDHLTLRALS